MLNALFVNSMMLNDICYILTACRRFIISVPSWCSGDTRRSIQSEKDRSCMTDSRGSEIISGDLLSQIISWSPVSGESILVEVYREGPFLFSSSSSFVKSIFIVKCHLLSGWSLQPAEICISLTISEASFPDHKRHLPAETILLPP